MLRLSDYANGLSCDSASCICKRKLFTRKYKNLPQMWLQHPAIKSMISQICIVNTTYKSRKPCVFTTLVATTPLRDQYHAICCIPDHSEKWSRGPAVLEHRVGPIISRRFFLQFFWNRNYIMNGNFTKRVKLGSLKADDLNYQMVRIPLSAAS